MTKLTAFCTWGFSRGSCKATECCPDQVGISNRRPPIPPNFLNKLWRKVSSRFNLSVLEDVVYLLKAEPPNQRAVL